MSCWGGGRGVLTQPSTTHQSSLSGPGAQIIIHPCSKQNITLPRLAAESSPSISCLSDIFRKFCHQLLFSKFECIFLLTTPCVHRHRYHVCDLLIMNMFTEFCHFLFNILKVRSSRLLSSASFYLYTSIFL